MKFKGKIIILNYFILTHGINESKYHILMKNSNPESCFISFLLIKDSSKHENEWENK